MSFIKIVLNSLTKRERLVIFSALAIFCIVFIINTAALFQAHSRFVPVSGGTYREGIVGQPISINPILSSNAADLDISALVYSRLSDLSSSHDVSNNNRTFTINLKEGLKWDDGEPLTSDDVIFTVETIQNPDSRSHFLKSWQGIVVERVSELQIRFTLPTPYVFFMENAEKLPIIPKHIFGNIPLSNIHLSSYNLEPVGSGPYKFKKLTQHKNGFITSYHLQINDLYHGRKPFIKNFYFQFYEDEESLIKAFRLHEIHGFGTSMPFEESIVPAQTIKYSLPTLRYYAVFFNQISNSALKEKNIRLALSLATPQQKIIDDVFDGNASPVNGPLINNISGENKSEYNPSQARELLEKTKMKNLTLNFVVPKIEFLQKTAEILKSEWLAIGIQEVNLITLEPRYVIDNVIKTGNYELLLFGNVLENQNDLFPFWHSSQRMYPGLNLSFYKNANVDSLIENIRQLSNEQNINSSLSKIEKLIINDTPAIFLYSIPYTYVHSPNLDGVSFDKSDNFITSPHDRFLNIHNWYVTKARVLK